MLNIQKIRSDFPILSQKINGKPLVYFDNGATSQKPQIVIDSIVDYYSRYNANIHRGVHSLSQIATDAYEQARLKIQKHFNSKHNYEIILTSGTTESINLVANGFASLLKKDDEIIVSALEHHSNIVPWQMLCEHTGAKLLVIPMNYDGELMMDEYEKLLSDKTKIVFCNHVSNALGTINPIEFIIEKAHKVGAAVLIDGAQACPHLKPDVQALDADFYVASAHKMCGPTGVGILYGKEEWLRKLPPYKGGGEMIATVTFEKTTYADLPHKFEAGTPNICGGIAFGVAIDYMNAIGFDNIGTYERELLEYGTKRLLEMDGIEIYGPKDLNKKASVISFNMTGIHPYDVGTIIDKLGIAVRTGHHCAQPIMDYYKIPGTIRASFAFYNTKEEIDSMIEALKKGTNDVILKTENMKTLSLILLTLLMSKSCSNEAQNDIANTTVQYTANTRGFFQKIVIINQKATIFRDRNGEKSPQQITISDTDWKEIIGYFEKIDLEKLPTLKDPTQKRFYDGAAIANLKIRYQDKNYETTDFDHGFPPEAIEKFVTKIVSLAKQEEE